MQTQKQNVSKTGKTSSSTQKKIKPQIPILQTQRISNVHKSKERIITTKPSFEIYKPKKSNPQINQINSNRILKTEPQMESIDLLDKIRMEDQFIVNHYNNVLTSPKVGSIDIRSKPVVMENNTRFANTMRSGEMSNQVYPIANPFSPINRDTNPFNTNINSFRRAETKAFNELNNFSISTSVHNKTQTQFRTRGLSKNIKKIQDNAVYSTSSLNRNSNNNSYNSKNSSASLIQKNFRGFFVRKQFKSVTASSNDDIYMNIETHFKTLENLLNKGLKSQFINNLVEKCINLKSKELIKRLGKEKTNPINTNIPTNPMEQSKKEEFTVFENMESKFISTSTNDTLSDKNIFNNLYKDLNNTKITAEIKPITNNKYEIIKEQKFNIEPIITTKPDNIAVNAINFNFETNNINTNDTSISTTNTETLETKKKKIIKTIKVIKKKSTLNPNDTPNLLDVPVIIKRKPIITNKIPAYITKEFKINITFAKQKGMNISGSVITKDIFTIETMYKILFLQRIFRDRLFKRLSDQNSNQEIAEYSNEIINEANNEETNYRQPVFIRKTKVRGNFFYLRKILKIQAAIRLFLSKCTAES